jgi:hypothetical protein
MENTGYCPNCPNLIACYQTGRCWPPVAKETPSSGSERRLVRVPWSADEDEKIKLDYAYANGEFNSHRSQAEDLNRKFHGGKPVRSASAVRHREGKLLSGSAN